MSNHKTKIIQSPICKSGVPLLPLHPKISCLLFPPHPFGNRHDYMHGKTLLGKSNDFNCLHCKCFSLVEKSSNHIVSLLILYSSSCCLYCSLSFCSFFSPTCFPKYTAMTFSLLFLALQGSSFLSHGDVTSSVTESAAKSISCSLFPTSHMQKQ